MNSKIKVILTRKRHILVIIASLSIMLFLGAYFYFSYEVKTIRSEAYNELKAIATLKISQITNWNNERFTDVKIFSQNPFFVGSLENSLGSKSNASLKSEIIKNFTLINANSDYSNIILFNIEGKSLLSLDSKFQQIDSTTARFIKRAVKEKKIISTDLYRSSLHNEIYLDYIAPVIDKNSFVFAVLILRVNPETFLYPIIKEWPVPSKTSETLIVRREDGSALYLNELNHRRSAALILTIPLTRKEVPAVQAVLGRKGIFEGVSYHGTNVLSYISPVIGAPWIMIAQIDNSEIYAGLYYKEFVTISFTVLLILALSGGLFWFYHYRQRNIFRELFVKEKELRAHHEEFKTILYSIGDGVITIDTNGNIKQMNRTAEELTGWNEDEAKGKPVEEVFNIINEATRNRVENPFHKVLGEGIIAGLANRTLLISKNGDEIPISDSGAPIKSETGEILGVVLIFRDQTEERIAQKTIEESRQRFLSLFTNMSEGVALHELVKDKNNHPVNYRLIDANPQFEKILGINRLEILGKLATEAYKTSEAPYLEIYSKAALTYKPYSFETYYEPRNKHFKISVVPWLQNGFAIIFTDITDRKLAEEALKESEKKYRDMVEGSPDAIAIYNEGKVVYANNACISLFRASSIDQLIGISIINFVHPDYKAFASERMKEIREFSNILPSREEKLLRLDGTEIVTEIKAIPITFNQRPAVQIIIRDITERKQAEEKLRNSEMKFRSLFEDSLMGVSEAAPGGHLIQANQAYLQMYGYTNLDEMKAEVNDIGSLYVNPKARKEGLRILAEKGVMEPREMEVVKRNGTRFFVLMSAREFRDVGGKPLYYHTNYIDITERKRTEEKLVESEARLSAIFYNASYSISIYKKSVWVSGNPAFVKLFGYKNLTELVGESVLETIAPEEGKRIAKIITDRAMGLEVPSHYETKGLRKDSSTFDMEVTISSYFINDEIYIIVFQSDITERKQAEKEIKESKKKLEKLYRHLNDSRENERAEIAREIHDELGQSLTALKMDLHWTLQNVPDDLRINEKLKGMIDIVSKTIKKVQKISSDLRPGMLDDLGLIPSLEWYTKEFEERTGITCSLELEKIPHLNPKIRLILFRIFQEGMTNIIRHANAKNVTVKLYSSPSQVFLKISDDGKGIKKEKINSKDSLGFIGMKERLREFDGTLEIISSAKNGAGLLISIPIVK
ncbi:MAG: PAS domain S-box protein [Ignavibacteriaceae bacterium]